MTSNRPRATSDLVWVGAGERPALVPVSCQEKYRGLQRAVKAIRDGVKILAVHPQVGRVLKDMDEAFRDWPIDFGDSGYVVRYRFDGEQVTILAVRHQRAPERSRVLSHR